MEEFKAPDQTQYDATVKAMTDFAQKHSDLKQYALIAPNSVNILSDRLPAFALSRIRIPGLTASLPP